MRGRDDPSGVGRARRAHDRRARLGWRRPAARAAPPQRVLRRGVRPAGPAAARRLPRRSGSTCGATAPATHPPRYEDCGFVAAAGDVVAVLDALGLEEVVLLGESLGGGTGILVDRLRPGLVRRLLLCEAIAMRAGRRPAGGREREPHVGDGAPPPGGVGRPGHGAGVVRQPSAAERDGARRARRLRALGLPRPARRSGRARRARPRWRRGSSSAAPGPTARPRRSTTWRRCTADVDDRLRRRHRPPRRHVRGAGRARRCRSRHRVTAPTSSCRRTPTRAAALVREHLAW